MHDHWLIFQVCCIRDVPSEIQMQLDQIKSLTNDSKLGGKVLKTFIEYPIQGGRIHLLN